MTTVIIVLVSFAIAFVAGFAVSKAYFTVHGLGDAGASARKQLKEQRQHYRKRIDELQGSIRDHEDAQELMRKKLGEMQAAAAKPEPADAALSEDIQGQIKIRDSEIAALRERIGPLNEALDAEKLKTQTLENELGLLRIERDELIALKQRIESEHAIEPAADGADSDQATLVARLREDMGTMRENLAARDRQILDLELQIKDSGARVLELEGRLESWKHRVQPLTRKLKEQRNTIRQYRDARMTPEKSCREAEPSESTDNLKKIRGIGPALERRLHKHGIRRYEQIAELSEHDLIEIAEQLAIAPNLAQRDRWIEQARDLALQSAASA
ncbi:MAG: helix-hairpin-helix domain-containing protein [Gammaproteobacteria bacterium]